MHLKSLYISYLLIITFHFCGIQFTFAQPGDHPFSVVTFDASGYHTNFKIYSCSAKYPYSSERSDSLEVVWKPDLKSLKIIDTLELVEITNETLRFPYSHYFRGKSCLTTNILMIIRDNTDTMLISTAGADPYALLLNHTSNEHNLPFLYPFQRGLFYLQKLISNLSAKSLFFLAHRDYFLNYYSSKKQVISMP